MYVSLDIETTGIDPNFHQIIEVAAVLETGARTQFFVANDELRFSGPYVIQMHKDLWPEYDQAAKVEPALIWDKIKEDLYLEDTIRYTIAGKNVGTFDVPFIDHYSDRAFQISHRTLDVGSLYATKNGIPTSFELFGKTTHRALDDALEVLELMKAKWAQLEK
jgi:DNA polymerase III epsilon subunit-like protein